ncbi:MAG: hypothetical protein ACLT98_08130 [Eggerthellaceae bacterium]
MGSYASGDERFFNASDEELELLEGSCAPRSQAPQRRFEDSRVIFTLLIAAMDIFLHPGLGLSHAGIRRCSLFSDTQNASQYFVESVEQDNIDAAMRGVVQDGNITIDGVDKSMSNSTVYVSAKTEEGGDVDYRIDIVRDLIGWKVSGIEMSFPSNQ